MIYPLEDVYRPSDYAFGIQTDIRALIKTGLTQQMKMNILVQ